MCCQNFSSQIFFLKVSPKNFKLDEETLEKFSTLIKITLQFNLFFLSFMSLFLSCVCTLLFDTLFSRFKRMNCVQRNSKVVFGLFIEDHV